LTHSLFGAVKEQQEIAAALWRWGEPGETEERGVGTRLETNSSFFTVALLKTWQKRQENAGTPQL